MSKYSDCVKNMIISFEAIKKFLDDHGVIIKGILHVGAHECEERAEYNLHGIQDSKIDWIEANPNLVKKNHYKGIINVHNAAISDVESDQVLHIASSMGSSSLLEFGTHAIDHPTIRYVDKIDVRTERLKNVINRCKIPIHERNFWNLDIQGLELHALKSAEEYIEHMDVLYSEVNVKEVYKGCGLLDDMDEFLDEKGYIRIMTDIVSQGWGDAVWVRKNVLYS